MKIVGLQSSPRGKNSNTLKLLNAALDGAREAGAEIELLDVTKLKIEYCTGCVSCYKTGKCHLKDDYPLLREKILEADGIILSSPNYISNITAPLKATFDRSANFIHEQLLDGKYGFSIMTAGSGDEEQVLSIMNNFIKRSGGTVIGGVGHSMARGLPGMEAAIKRSHEMGKDLMNAIIEKRTYPEQAAERADWKERFANTVRANKENWKHNYEYWVKMGWIKV
ncbi:MAG: flavodoxin family protein [Methanomassiliicoccales archaeon]|jgi:multimeric flavodoxin WrbA